MSVGIWLGLLGLLAVPIIVLIYLIKSKYVPKTVSSTFIWQRSLKYMKRKVPINFIMSLLLIMQILVVVASTLALMDIKTEPNKSDASIIVIDASASMRAKNGGKSRYEVALDKLRAQAEKVDVNSGMVIILADDDPNVLTESHLTDEEGNDIISPFVYNKDDVVAIIDQQLKDKCSNTDTDINAALALAQKAVDFNSEAKIYLYTDRLYDDPDTVNIVNCADTENDWNAGITSFTDAKLAAGYEYSATVINDGKEAEFVITLKVDGGVVATKKISMGKGETRKITFSPRSTENSDAIKIKSIKSYENAEIELNTDTDIIVDDNKAYLYAVPEADIRILYVSNMLRVNNGVIDTTSQTTLQLILGANGYVINSTDTFHSSQIKNAPTSGYDLYIYEGIMPVSMPTDGAVWFMNAPSSPVGTNISISDLEKNSTLENISTGYILTESSVMQGAIAQEITRNVNFDVPLKIIVDGILKELPASVSKYKVIGEVNEKTGEVKYTIPENFEAIYNCTYNKGAASITTPVMLAGTVGTTRTIITTFDFANSSLPVFIADFPVLIKNMVEYSMPETMPERTPTIGDTLQFNAPAGVESIIYYYKTFQEELEDETTNGKEINRWDGQSIELPKVVLDQLGIYNIVINYKPETTFDEDGKVIEIPAESDTYSVSTYMPLSESDITAKGPRLTAPIPEVEKVDRHGQSILWILVLVLIAFLIIEWGVYYRDEY